MLENQPTLTNKWIIGYDRVTRESSPILFYPTPCPDGIYCVTREFFVVKLCQSYCKNHEKMILLHKGIRFIVSSSSIFLFFNINFKCLS